MIQDIPSARLRFDAAHPDCPPIEAGFCKDLAKSIEHVGLLQKPLVRPDGDGDYRVIAGRKRVHAVTKILKWKSVPCDVVEGLDAEMEEAATLAENLFRREPKGAMLTRALARYWELYQQKHPDAKGGRGAYKQAAREKKEKIEAAEAEKGEPLSEEEVEAIEEEVAEKSRSFAEELERILGCPERTARRLALVASHLSPDQLDVLGAARVTQQVCEAIAALDDPGAVTRAVNLIASGLDHREAVRLAALAPDARAPAQGEPPPRAEHELTDDEWMAQHCAGPLGTIRHRSPFLRDALLYRKVEVHLRRLKKAVAEALDEARSEEGNGFFYSALYRICKATHPGAWEPCAACRGGGVADAGAKCPRCYGSAYMLTLAD